MSRCYLCDEIIYTNKKIAELWKKTVEEVNDKYDLGKPISINGNAIVLSPITERQLMWIMGGKNRSNDRSIYCPIGVPIDVNAYNFIINKFLCIQRNCNLGFSGLC